VRAAFDASSTMRCASSAPFEYRLRGAAAFVDREKFDALSRLRGFRRSTGERSVLLAAQAEQQHGVEIGVAAQSRQVALTRARSTDVWQHTPDGA
jgi:hypothetical protein